MFSTHVLLIVIVCGTAFVHGDGGKRGVCRYSSDGPRCRSDFDCNGPEVHCYKRRCCVRSTYACPWSSNRYDDPLGFPPLVHRCLKEWEELFCGWGYYCLTRKGGTTEILGVCCPKRFG